MSLSYNAAHQLEWLRADDQGKVRLMLGSDFERLTAQPVILDDLCMLLIEKIQEINQEEEAIYKADRAAAMEPDLFVRANQLSEELTLISALLFRYPEVPRHYEAKAHIKLDWKSLLFVTTMPLNNNPPLRNIAVRNYVSHLLKNIDVLSVFNENRLR